MINIIHTPIFFEKLLKPLFKHLKTAKLTWIIFFLKSSFGMLFEKLLDKILYLGSIFMSQLQFTLLLEILYETYIVTQPFFE